MRHSSVGITLGVYRTVTQGEIKAEHERCSPVADTRVEVAGSNPSAVTSKANKATPDKRTSSNPHLFFALNLFLVSLFLLFLGLLGFFHIFSSLSSHLFLLSFLILSFIIIYVLILPFVFCKEQMTCFERWFFASDF